MSRRSVNQGAAASRPGPVTSRRRFRPLLARLSFALAAAAVAVLVVFGGLRSIAMLAVGVASATVSLAAAFWFLADRGLRRWVALALVVLSPIAVIVVFALASFLWVALVAGAAWLLAGLAARAALAPDPAHWRMPETAAQPAATHPFFIMNPRSGGGKVERFDLKRKAEERGAEVFLMSGPETVDVAEVARRAVASGADLLGVAGGDGTQALVAGVAAEYGIPFVVVTAGTRNHFALDLGLDRDDPATCLSALDDGVDLLVDLGCINGQTFVNNASFGAYAEIVLSPDYRGDKLGSTLDLLPDVLRRHRGPTLVARCGMVEIRAPQAVLVANNPYGAGDLAGLSRRARLDRGELGIVGVRVESARDSVALMRGARAPGLTVLTAPEVVVDADVAAIPVGVDGEALSMTTPVRCSVRPCALRVRVPRNRPGIPPPRGQLNWAALRREARPGHRGGAGEAPRPVAAAGGAGSRLR